ncbi:MAG TPA: outer membrane protein transport protein [Candidatus Polarisedimenticolaceae bacterium]|nr:outer membrane protein transport protein [Candidatus Polarisedimenticolaceae bacterium]
MRATHVGVSAFILLLTTGSALGAGFGFAEQGAKASGQAGAWIARADDAAANWYNPAALVHLEAPEVQLGLNYLDTGSDTQFSPAPGVSFDAAANATTPAHFYFAQRIGERLAWGIGLNTPFGLITEWSDPPLTFSSRRAELRTYLVNPNAAVKLGEHWSIAAGVDYLSAEVREFSRDAVIGLTPTTVNLTGEGDDWGYNLAVQLKTGAFSAAAQYRSHMKPEIDGRVSFSGPLGNLLNSSASTAIAFPAETLLGAAWTSRRVDVEIAGYLTEWSDFERISIDTGNPATSLVIVENWDDTWSYRLGVAVRPGSDERHEIRAGGVLDESPVPTQYLRPSIPDSDRTGYSLGYGYLADRWGIDAYAMQLEFDDATANGSLLDGVINGTYSTSILLVGATFKYRF